MYKYSYGLNKNSLGFQKVDIKGYCLADTKWQSSQDNMETYIHTFH